MASPRFHPFVRLVLALVGAIAMMVLVALVIDAGLKTAGRMTGQAIDPLEFVKRNILLVTILGYPPVLAWLWFCRRAFDRQTFVSLGLRLPGAMRALGLGALCGALAISFLFGLLWVTGNVHINGPSPDAFEIGPLASLAVLVFFALAFFGVGFMEEIAFRGYALHNLSAWLGIRVAIGMQAVAFALVHLGNVSGSANQSGGASGSGMAMANDAAGVAAHSISQAFWDSRWAMLNIALIGWFFALCYLKTGSLWFPIGFHAAWDFFLGCVWSLPVSGLPVFRILDVSVSPNALVTGGSFGAEGSIFLPAITTAMIVLLRQMPDHPQAHHDLALLRRDKNAPATPLETPALATESSVLVNQRALLATTNGAIAPAMNEQAAAENLADESAPSRFKTSMRPAPRFGQAPEFDAAKFDEAQWSPMSTHAAATESFAAQPNEIAADSALRVDVTEAQMSRNQANDSAMPDTIAAPLQDDGVVASGGTASVQPGLSSLDAIEQGQNRDANIGVRSPIFTASPQLRETAPDATTTTQAPPASPAPLVEAANVSRQVVAPVETFAAAASSELETEAAAEAADDSGRELTPDAPQGETPARPAVKKSSPRW